MRIIGVFCVLYVLIFGVQFFSGIDLMEIGIENAITNSLMGLCLMIFFLWLAYLCFKSAAKKEDPSYIKKQEEIKVVKAEAQERIKRAKMETENYQNLLRKQIETEIKNKKVQDTLKMRIDFEEEQKQRRELKLFMDREVLKARGIPSCPKCGSTYITTVSENGASRNVCSLCGHKYFPSQYV